MVMTYLGVVLDSLHGLLLSLAGTGTELSLQALLLLLVDLASVGAIIVLGSFRAGIQSLVVLLHGDQGLGLAHVGADELGVTLGGLVAVLNGLREGHQLDEGGSTVGVTAGVLGRPLDHLGESLDGTRPVSLLELLLSQFTGLLGLGGVNVGLLLGLGLGLLGVAQLSQDIGCAVLSERLVVVLDGLGKVAQLLVCSTDSSESPVDN